MRANTLHFIGILLTLCSPIRIYSNTAEKAEISQGEGNGTSATTELPTTDSNVSATIEPNTSTQQTTTFNWGNKTATDPKSDEATTSSPVESTSTTSSRSTDNSTMATPSESNATNITPQNVTVSSTPTPSNGTSGGTTHSKIDIRFLSFILGAVVTSLVVLQ